MVLFPTHSHVPACDLSLLIFTSSFIFCFEGSRVARIISLSQFRPEKNHELQLEAMAKLLQLYKTKSLALPDELSLIICGGVRCKNDQAIVDRLRARAQELGLGTRVQFEVNQPFNKIKKLLVSSKVLFHLLPTVRLLTISFPCRSDCTQ